jgi:transposase InsO family protein
MRFAFIHAEKANFPVAALCRVLKVTRQGYYAFRSRPAPELRPREIAFREEVRQIHAESRGTYGSPRVLHALKSRGVSVSKRRVEQTLRALGLCARVRRRFRQTTKANPSHATAPNILDRKFSATAPNQCWVTDITYIWTDEGWCYLAAILDLFSRSVVGWALDTTLSTDLAMRALQSAVKRRHPERLMHHSDRGCQYTSEAYRSALRDAGIEVSMSRKGNCWDNAVAESFFSTLKNELIHRRRWSTRLELQAALFDYIEVFYNRKRLHSTLGFKTPAQIENEYAATQAV